MAQDGVELKVGGDSSTAVAPGSPTANLRSRSKPFPVATASKRARMCCKISKENRNCMILFVVWWVLLCVGGAVFCAIEFPEEERIISEFEALRLEYESFAEQLLSNATLRESLNKTALIEMIGEYSAVLDYDYRVRHWYFSKAMLFSFTVVTTIGEWMSHISCRRCSGSIRFIVISSLGIANLVRRRTVRALTVHMCTSNPPHNLFPSFSRLWYIRSDHVGRSVLSRILRATWNTPGRDDSIDIGQARAAHDDPCIHNQDR